MESEAILAEWQEPTIHKLSSPNHKTIFYIGGAVVICAILLFVGYTIGDTSLYLAAGVVAAALFTLLSSKHTSSHALPVTLTTEQLQIGRKIYALVEFSGFWITNESDFLVVNLKPKKASAISTSVLYPTQNITEVKDLFLNVLPEIQPPEMTLSDKLTSFIRF